MRTNAVLMFAVGAIAGYFIAFYFADLFWVRDSISTLVATFIIAPAGAVVLGMISAFFARGVAIFAAAAVIGYLVVTFGWMAYAHLFDIADREGGKGMAMILIIAPLGGALIGLIAAALLGRRDARAPQETP